MNRKVLVIFAALVAVAMMATPLVGIAQAGKGQTTQYFMLYMEGMTTGPPERVWTSDGITHLRGLPWIVIGAFKVTIGATTTSLTPADYSGYLDFNVNSKTMEFTITVHETITVAGGTLEIMSVDKMSAVTGIGSGTFVGHGTGALEGVKVQGATSGQSVGGIDYITREGTVMGWP